MTAVTLRGVQLTRGSTPILRDVSLEVQDGEFCVFVGPSGCGKSTLLRLVAGLDDDHEGQIEIDGRPMAGVPPAQRQVAMVFQGYALYPHMTVRENMAFALRRAGLPAAEIDARIGSAARILQLEEQLQRKPGSLSGGQRQRVAIGRAIVKKPKVFLFDEPLSNLDAGLRGQTRLEIAKLHRDLGSASMLYVTHDQVEAMTLADRIVLLRPIANTDANAAAGQGSVVQVGTPMDLYHRPANLFAARFIGTPGMNLIECPVAALGDAGVTVELQGRRWLARVSPTGLNVGDPVTLGVRPEHLDISGGSASTDALQAQVTHVEPLGEHSVLHMVLTGMGTVADPPAVLAKTTNEQIRVGDALPLTAVPAALHVFNRDGVAQPRLT
jgi:multiple sugar transport system ATP-binding protein